MVLFLNCFLRSPRFFFHDDHAKRIKLIPKYTISAKNTICGLAEVFGNTNCKELSNEYRKHKYNFVAAHDTSSGLALAYNNSYELVDHFFEPYKSRKLPDSLVNKGIMFCILRCKKCGKHINILITHLQSSYPESSSKRQLEKYERIQKEQLQQLKRFIDRHKIDNYILMGDFNINKNLKDPLFKFFLKLFDYTNQIDKLPCKATYKEGEKIYDFILIKGNRHCPKTRVLDTQETKIVQENKKLDRAAFISDHYAIMI